MADSGKTIFGYLQDIYTEYGYYKEDLLSVTKPGKEGVEQIQQIMKDLRSTPPTELAGSPVVKVIDYTNTEDTNLPKSNVLQFFSEDGSKVSARPSGTEPKIKFYFSAKGDDADRKISALFAQFEQFAQEY